MILSLLELIHAMLSFLASQKKNFQNCKQFKIVLQDLLNVQREEIQ